MELGSCLSSLALCAGPLRGFVFAPMDFWRHHIQREPHWSKLFLWRLIRHLIKEVSLRTRHGHFQSYQAKGIRPARQHLAKLFVWDLFSVLNQSQWALKFLSSGGILQVFRVLQKQITVRLLLRTELREQVPVLLGFICGTCFAVLSCSNGLHST